MRRYTNTEDHPLQGLRGFLHWRLTAKRVAPLPSPLARNEPDFLCSNRSATTLTWIGHATFLYQVGGLNVLTDPQLSLRASPVQWLGPRRLVAPGLVLRDLPPIDVVVISHNHYDHLDRQTVRALARLDPPPRLCLAPAGLRRKLERWGLPSVADLDWWESHRHGDLTAHAVPVKHSSVRHGLDRNRTRWCGWLLDHPRHRFLFAGDSAYSSDFATIRRRLGSPDLAALPIGAYEPRWFMQHVHATPEEAVQIHQDLGCKRSVAMHWGTFILTDEPVDEPPRRLAAARAAAGLADESFVLLQHGETMVLERPDGV